MRILRHYENIPAEARDAVVAIGNFDGVHRGHQAVIDEAGRLARAAGVAHAVMTFEPHPRGFFNPEGKAFRLTSLRAKAHQIETRGADFLFVLHFDEAFAAMSAENFVADVLVGGLGASHLVVGYDFVFGHMRAGDTALLASLTAERGVGLTVLDPVADGGEVFSSSRVRASLKEAKPRRAAELLGRFWEIEGRVREGERRGRQLGYPTANLDLDDFLEPALGIYAVRGGLERDGGVEWRDGVASLGRRPTFGGTDIVLEVHLFDFDEDIYGQYLRVAFVDYIREEKFFDDIAALKAEIAADCEAARRILASAGDHGGSRPVAPAMASQRARS